MTHSPALACAIRAAKAAGALMLKNRWSVKKINSETQHDIKLELDVRCQKTIERVLRKEYPKVPILGEEGLTGNIKEPTRWVVDPIDGTVNFAHGIPHSCVSIALQQNEQSVVAVVYDPFTDELFTAIRGQRAKLNGRPISVSKRAKLEQAIVFVGFAKNLFTMMLPTMTTLTERARKIRIMGSAALAAVYVAAGRADIYLEYGVRLWDVAAGGLIIECAGGEFWNRQLEGEHAYHVIANNGLLRSQLEGL
ncbi:MAG TPA: inositol monophosphatase family protein [Verrucomicrobiae bacterium]|nr:inositol monophosphatase family protein [Verrucomicrobiae bacterium]